MEATQNSEGCNNSNLRRKVLVWGLGELVLTSVEVDMPLKNFAVFVGVVIVETET
jgi:hypothetical protein